MFNLSSMQTKFFPKDVIGGKKNVPEKEGDTFKAKFFGQIYTFKVEKHCGSFFMCVIVG
jgi:hypothetical protein